MKMQAVREQKEKKKLLRFRRETHLETWVGVDVRLIFNQLKEIQISVERRKNISVTFLGVMDRKPLNRTSRLTNIPHR